MLRALKSFDFYGPFCYLVGLVNHNGNKNDERSSALKEAGPLLGIGIELALYILIFLMAGRYLDNRWDTDPWLTLLGAALGFAAGIYSLFKTVSGLDKPGNRNR